jgi:hypothetical protein
LQSNERAQSMVGGQCVMRDGIAIAAVACHGARDQRVRLAKPIPTMALVHRTD